MPNPTVFIAEDDSTILELLRIRLGVVGYSTLYARDGIAAIAGITKSLPSAVVLDIGQPECDGFEVLRALRENPRTRNIPVLVLTARHEASDVQRAISCGAQDYLAKPFDDRKLLARVARLLKKTRPAQSGGTIHEV